MSCRRISRELIERFRFGDELDSRSVPHLAHLVDCAACREEVGLDRTLVIQLQRALRARIEGHEPSPRAFNAVRIRALASETVESWPARLFRWVRLVPAGAAVAIMLVAVVSAVDGNRAPLLETRTITWPGFMERVDNGPLTPKEAAWWLEHQPAPRIQPPDSGLIATLDPSPSGRALPPPKPATGFIE
jgi:anti-sigma factor RsiW